MRELNEEDILKNKVDTIAQYHILNYLKKELLINEFKIYLVDDDNIKVIDIANDSLVFSYNKEAKEVIHQEEIIDLEIEIEIGI